MSVEAIKELRAKTHLGLSECKSALTEADGDINKALEILQQKNLRLKPEAILTAVEGVCFARVEGNHGVIAEVNSQTDFASRSDIFQEFVQDLVDYGFDWNCGNDLANCQFAQNNIQKVSKQLGEQLVIRRSRVLDVDGKIFAYNHPGGKIAVLVSLEFDQENDEVNNFGEDLSMHIAAVNPMCVSRDEMDAEKVQKQTEIFVGQASILRLSQAQIDKIVEGKLNKWFAENCLLEQESVVHPKNIIKDLLPGNVKVKQFVRFERGSK